LKNHDDFMQAVYAKADVKRKQIKRRNTMIRNATVSFVCTFVVALAVVPISRMFMQQPQQPVVPFIPVADYNYPIDVERMLPMGDELTPDEIEQLVRDNIESHRENNFAARNAPPQVVVAAGETLELHSIDDMAELADVLAANYLPGDYDTDGEPISLPVVPRFAGAVTIESVDSLLEFLAGLPSNVHLLQQLMDEYDDEFFSENVLMAMPIGIGVPLAQSLAAGPGAIDVEPDQPEDEPPSIGRGALDNWHANVDSDLMLLLLVPMSIAE